MPRIVLAEDMSVIKTWVDASYAVHTDMKSHTGGAVSLGRGLITASSNKQKLNTKSSTEAELVGASDYLPAAIWSKMFIESKGYKIEVNKFYQDKQITMKFEKNGRNSCGKQLRHINIRYFRIKDRLNKERIEVVHCPTHIMVANFFTKPLQGALFKKLRDIIMGITYSDSLQAVAKKKLTLPPVQERVGNNRKQLKVEGKNRPEGSNVEMAVPMTHANAVKSGLSNQVLPTTGLSSKPVLKNGR